jgi:FAD/FMN-containing dehydrogenase
MTAIEERVGSLSKVVSGTVLMPEDSGYDEARQCHNGLIDKRPALIVRCRNAADVTAAIAFAREAGLEISIRGGGHNVGGRAVTEGGVMIDLAEMKGIEVDADRRTARAEGGVTWAEFNNANAEHGLAVTGGLVSTTGIAGYTLGGGLGWLMGSHGLAADNLISVELVTATGDVLHVTSESHPDLLWALRGGGGNFGVATSFEYRLHPLREVTAGLVAHPIDAAPEVLRFYREFTKTVPDELGVLAALVHAPDGSGAKLAAIALCHAGSPDQAERDIAAVREFGSPVLAEIGRMPYPASNTLLDEAYPKGALNYWKSSFVRDLDDAFLDAVIERFASTPSPMTAIALEHFHGAVTRIGATDTAVPHRDEGYNLLITSVWMDPATTEENLAWTRESFDAFSPHFVDRRWLNYLVDDDGTDAVRAAYGPNYDRLVEVKGRYDPENVFRLNHNIRA